MRAGLCTLPVCLIREIRLRFDQIQCFDDVAVQHFVAFALELQAAGGVGNSLATVVAAVDSGVLSTLDLIDRLVGVDLDAIEEHGHHCLLRAFAILESCGSAISDWSCMAKW